MHILYDCENDRISVCVNNFEHDHMNDRVVNSWGIDPNIKSRINEVALYMKLVGIVKTSTLEIKKLLVDQVTLN